MIPSHDRETVSQLLSRVLTQLLTCLTQLLFIYFWLMAGARHTRHMGRGSGSITAAAIIRSVFMMSPLGKIPFADLYSSFVIPVVVLRLGPCCVLQWWWWWTRFDALMWCVVCWCWQFPFRTRSHVA
jgi:hypothetical protein